MAVMQTQQTHKVTIELPEPIYQLLAEIADASQQPLEALAAQSVTGNLPPSVEIAPASLRNDLLRMQSMSLDELVGLANEHTGSIEGSRHLELLERNATGQLSAQEREELSRLRIAADELMIRKAYAWALLRWRGYRVPPLDELPLP